MTFLDRLGEVFPGYEGYANLLRGGYTEAEFNAVKPDGRVYDLAAGPISHEVSLEVRGRTARFSLPQGWAERNSAELEGMRALEPLSGQTTLHWGMYREDVPREAIYSMSIYSFLRSEVGSKGFMAQPHIEQWPLKMARDTGLKIVAPIRIVRFGGGTGYYWDLSGTMPGYMLSRPHQPVLHMHSIEMWAPVPGGAIVRLLGVAPSESAETTARDFNTVVASWRW